MEVADKNKKRISPVLFVVSTLCFLFPFITVSCNNGQKLASFTGVQLATGTTIEEPQMFGPTQKRHIVEPLATVAWLCTLAGVGVAFLRGRTAVFSAALSGSLGALFMLLLKTKLDSDILKSGQGMLHLDYGLGYTVALMALISGAAWNFYVFSRTKKEQPFQATGAATSGRPRSAA